MQSRHMFGRFLGFCMLCGGVRTTPLSGVRSVRRGRMRTAVYHWRMCYRSSGARQREDQGDTKNQQSLNHKLSSAEN